MYVLGKIFNSLMNPAILGCFFLAVVALGLLLRRQYRFAIGAFLVLAWFWFWSSSFFFCRFGGALEREFPPQEVEKYPVAPYIVLLGGGMASHPVAPYPELFSAADRVWQAARLYHAGKAPKIIISGVSESKTSYLFLQDLGVPKESIVVEDKARNTVENAKLVRSILEKEGTTNAILLVTSAWHLKRAKMLFEQERVPLVAVGCDYEALFYSGKNYRFSWMQLVPGHEMMWRNSIVLKEYLGCFLYSMRRAKQD